MATRREFLGTAAALTAGGVLLGADEKKLPGKTKHTKFAVNLEMWWPREKTSRSFGI